MIWYLNTLISDNGIQVNGIDRRVVFPYKECGGIIGELFEYAIDMHNKSFSTVAYKEKNILKTDIYLPRKDEESNYLDLRYAVKSFKYISSIFFSLGIIPEPKTIEENLFFELTNLDISHRADTLEYYLLNNVDKHPTKKRGYYNGRLELGFFRLIQEMYSLALNNNDKCRWMLAFRTPIQIWFIYQIQAIYLLLSNPELPCDRPYYKQTIESEKKIYQDCLKTIEESKNHTSFFMSMALQYTIAQLVLHRTPLIETLYSDYLASVKQQAYAMVKTDKYRNCESILQELRNLQM